jgi:integrase
MREELSVPQRTKAFGAVLKQRSGRWQASYEDPRPHSGRRRYTGPVTFARKGDARKWLDQVSADISRGTWKPPSEAREALAFGQYAATWLERRPLKPRTRACYRTYLEGHILPRFARELLTDITPAEVTGWYGKLLTDRPAHRKHVYDLMHTIMQTAWREDLIDANPCRVVVKRKPPKPVKPATVAELNAMTDAMPPQYRLAVPLAAWCALRFGELAELRRKDVDLEAGVIRIRRGLTHVKASADAPREAVIGTPKSAAGVRDVAMPGPLVELVKAHLAEYVGPGPDALLFTGAGGQSLPEETLRYHWHRARARAGRPDLPFHGLRHTGAVMYAAAGATVKESMRRLGHTSPAMAMRYQDYVEGRDRTLTDRMAELMAGGGTGGAAR